MAIPLHTRVVICSQPISGHIIPMLTISKHLVVRGYEICFISGSAFRPQIEATGASFWPVEEYGDFSDHRIRELIKNKWTSQQKSFEGVESVKADLVHISKKIPWQLGALQKALKMLNDEDSDRPIVVMTESLYMGALPLVMGAPGIRPAGHLAIGVTPMQLTSIDHHPFGPGLPPDSSPQGRERNKSANENQRQVFAEAQTAFEEAFVEVGARKPESYFFDALYSLPDRFIQMCAPSVEYPRSDAPKTLRFSGGHPTAFDSVRELDSTRPAWWHQFTSNKTKKVIFVCQGTLCPDLHQLVVPTMTAFKERPDVIVVIALGEKGAVMPADVPVPSNCKVADYIPYDDVLPYSDVFVTTGGYGSFQRALSNGVPVVIGGDTEDKPETAARAEWAGVGMNLHTGYPSVENMRRAVEEILENKKYKARALEIQAEMRSYDPIGVIVENIEELARRSI